MSAGLSTHHSDEVLEALDALSISSKSGGPQSVEGPVIKREVPAEEGIVGRGHGAPYVQDFSQHHYGATFYSTNHNYGPIYNIGHVENANFKTSDDFVLLDTLPKHPDLTRSRDEYFPDSRTDDVKKVWEWADDPKAESILWIHGPAGLGKSTLARHLRQDLQSRTRLAAAAFLSDLPTDAWGAESVLRLIAGELGRIHDRAVPAIAEAVRKCHGAPIQEQLEKFILNPIRALQHDHPLIVLMDGTDEWTNFPSFVGTLACFASHTSLVRFLLLGRGEPRPGGSIRGHRLECVPATVMIKYVNSRFDAIEWEHGRRPSREQVLSIVECSEGMFVWTAIVCALLENGLSAVDPLEVMAGITYKKTIQGSDSLWKLYFHAINLLLPNDEDKAMLRVFLGGNVVISIVLKVADFASLMGMRVLVVRNIQSRLKALRLLHPDDGDLMVYPLKCVYHLSFMQYLRTPSVPAAVAFPISLQSAHNQLGLSCLRQVTSFLPTSCNLESLYLSPLRKYTVEHLHFHLAVGSPPMAPGENAEWKESPHYSIIQNTPIGMYLQWADLFVAMVASEPHSDWPPLEQGKPFSEAPYSKGVGRLLVEVANRIGPTHWTLSPVYCVMMAALLQPEDPEIWSALAVLWDEVAEFTVDEDFVNRAVEASQNSLKAANMEQVEDQAELQMVYCMCLMSRFRRTQNMEDLNRGTALSEEVLLHRPIGHPQRGIALSNMAAMLAQQYELAATQSLDDLDRAISLVREATSLAFTEVRFRLLALHNKARLLCTRFKATGDIKCLDESISVDEEALALLPSPALRSCVLDGLAESLHLRFEEHLRLLRPSANVKADSEELQRSLELYQDAMELRPEKHPQRPATLVRFAQAVYCYFETGGDPRNLETAIEALREAITLATAGFADAGWPVRVCFVGLSHCLRAQFNVTKHEEDIEEAVVVAREVAENYSTWDSLHCLSCALRNRFEHSGSKDDLEESLSLSREAYERCPIGHVRYWAVVLSLARNLHHHSRLMSHSEEKWEAFMLVNDGMDHHQKCSEYGIRLLIDGTYYLAGETFASFGMRRFERL